MMTALTRCRTALSKAASVSRPLLALRIKSWTPNARAAACASRIWDSEVGFPGLTSKPITVASGTSSRNSSSRFAPSVFETKVTPVMLPPGRLKFDTRQSHRIGARRKDDRNCCGCSFGSHCSWWGQRDDRGYRISYQISGHCRQSVEARVGRAIFDCDVAAFDITSILEALP